MYNSTNNTIKKACDLFKKGERQKILDVLENIDNYDELSEEDKIIFKLLKCKAKHFLGEYEESLKINEWVIKKSKEIGNKILSLDGTISRREIYFRTGSVIDGEQSDILITRKAETNLIY